MPISPTLSISAASWTARVEPALNGGGSTARPAAGVVDANAPAGIAVRKKADPFVEFEAFALQTFVQAMLPNDAETVFGSGVAGATWKSMLAEKLARELAESGAVGIAKMLARSSGNATSEPLPASPEQKLLAQLAERQTGVMAATWPADVTVTLNKSLSVTSRGD